MNCFDLVKPALAHNDGFYSITKSVFKTPSSVQNSTSNLTVDEATSAGATNMFDTPYMGKEYVQTDIINTAALLVASQADEISWTKSLQSLQSALVSLTCSVHWFMCAL